MFGLGGTGALAVYVAAYTVAIVGCGVALRRAVSVDDDETRRGLVALLVASGGWAVAQLAYLLAPTADLQYALYLTGLVVGLTTIGGWLYFCSAYTGRSFHRDRTYRRVAVGAYLAVVAIKVTNPFHQLYFTAEFVATPFPHLAVQQGLAHWVVTGLSYSLVAIGFFMLFDQFLEADFDTRPLGALVGATALPVTFDLTEMVTPVLLDLSMEPVGVAVFAVGTLYVFEDRFLSVQLSDGVDEALIYLDEDDRVREANDLARDTLPALRGARGEPIAEVLPEVAAELDGGEGLLDRVAADGHRYYLVTTTEFVRAHGSVGRLVMLSDVTGSERRRQELARQNEQLESFAAAMRHELFNTLQIVAGRVEIAGTEPRTATWRRPASRCRPPPRPPSACGCWSRTSPRSRARGGPSRARSGPRSTRPSSVRGGRSRPTASSSRWSAAAGSTPTPTGSSRCWRARSGSPSTTTPRG
ncbi:histidine kinase N-terminal 7TM domain-containing protein [Halobaculum litoreum]|uniref:Histidine kinase N-terminal 7TM domain-containing protein n=1 Tax=Halobaculum litoreum TaxID=3031998 RepID=A0ABD5XS41_9EURY